MDDEKEARDILENLLLEEGNVEIIAKISNAAEALKEIINHEPDILFLDINMPRINGFDLMKEIRELNLNPNIIFVTGYDHFVMDAIKFQAFDYLLKPIDQDELASTLQRLRLKKKPEEMHEKLNTLIRKLDGERIRFNTRQGFIVVDLKKIIYCEANGNYTILNLTGNIKETVTSNLGHLEGILPADKFSRINRSFIINLTYLTRVDRKRKQCELRNDPQIYSLPMSRESMQAIDKLLK